ncbi:MAG: DUF6338 family protein [Planctomycetota bacterium]|nr:DUF6338 family protein [Planctomycetota bacterium]
MDIPKSEIIETVYALLPGFFAAWVFYGLTAHPKTSPFERIVQALIFTGITHVCVIVIRWIALTVGESVGATTIWTDNAALVLSFVAALVLGVGSAAIANTNCLHSRIPWITKRTSYPSEWFSTFNQDKRWIVLHLDGGRRLYGWPYEWPDQPDSGHFVMMEAAWLLDDNTRVALHLIQRILIPAADVRMVEFKKFDTETTATQEEVDNAENLLINLQTARQEDDKAESDAEGTVSQER